MMNDQYDKEWFLDDIVWYHLIVFLCIDHEVDRPTAYHITSHHFIRVSNP